MLSELGQGVGVLNVLAQTNIIVYFATKKLMGSYMFVLMLIPMEYNDGERNLNLQSWMWSNVCGWVGGHLFNSIDLYPKHNNFFMIVTFARSLLRWSFIAYYSKDCDLQYYL